MFGWLANLFIKGPILGSSCACCDAKKAELKMMQQAIENGYVDDTLESTGQIIEHESTNCETKGHYCSVQYHVKISGSPLDEN